ncbi:MAG: helix-turn-helix domain-containing protein [Halovenus sp.]|uniref:helix-turn-helix domain-containing protein n=1 Tax=Halovenus amylolytica TaxID=2500550 RepID=UPI000FE3D191
MSWIAEFTLPAADFPLGKVFEDWPWLTLELDRVVPTGDTVMPYFWVHLNDNSPSFSEIEALFADLPELRSGELMDEVDGKGLFRALWEPEYMGVMSAIPRADLTVVSATGSTDGWLFELRAESGDQFSEFQQLCEADGISVELARLSRLSEEQSGSEYGLTDEQKEALLVAYRGRYYHDSRQTDMESLARQLDISRQAFSDRLKRGYRNLIENTIIQGEKRVE